MNYSLCWGFAKALICSEGSGENTHICFEGGKVLFATEGDRPVGMLKKIDLIDSLTQ